MTASRVSAWLDGEIEAHACDAMCEQLGAPHASNLEAAIDMCLIGHVLREQAQGVAHSARSARVLAALQVSYESQAALSTTPFSQDNVRAAPAALSQRAANDPWFNWRATGSAVAVALALGVWWQMPGADTPITSSPMAAAAPSVVVETFLAESSRSVAMSRDPHIDAFLAAHRQTGASNAWPGAVGFVRNVAWSGATQ
ncbi:MAG: hypothetical protein QMB19_11115 [Burkholderiaceae bacterium]